MRRCRSAEEGGEAGPGVDGAMGKGIALGVGGGGDVGAGGGRAILSTTNILANGLRQAITIQDREAKQGKRSGRGSAASRL